MWRRKLRMVVFYLVLLIGNLSGVAMRPKDIEESLHSLNQTKVERSTREDNENEEDDEDEFVS